MATRTQIERLAQRIESLGKHNDGARLGLGVVILEYRGQTEEEARARHKRFYPCDDVDSMPVINLFMTCEEWEQKYCGDCISGPGAGSIAELK